MFNDLTIIVPYRSLNRQRERIFKWTMRRYEALFPDAELIVGKMRSEGLFCLAEARNEGAAQATRPILLFADADAVAFPLSVLRGISQLERVARVFPYGNYHHLSEVTTAVTLASDPAEDPRDVHPFTIDASYPNSTSGLVLMAAATFENSGRYDERFKGWGAEDQAHDLAVATLCGPSERPTAGDDLYHLWHQRAAAFMTENPGYEASCALWDRYKAAADSPTAMQALVEEWR